MPVSAESLPALLAHLARSYQTPGLYPVTTCRQCGTVWLEGIWAAGERPVQRYYCFKCEAPPPHPMGLYQIA